MKKLNVSDWSKNDVKKLLEIIDKDLFVGMCYDKNKRVLVLDDVKNVDFKLYNKFQKLLDDFVGKKKSFNKKKI